MTRSKQPRHTSNGEKPSGSRRSTRQQHRTRSHAAQTSSSFPSEDSDGFCTMEIDESMTNGDAAYRRLPPNPCFSDMMFFDPPYEFRAGQVMSPGMCIRATSTPEYADHVIMSSAVACLYRGAAPASDIVGNTAVPAMADVVLPTPELDQNYGEYTVTVQFSWNHVVIRDPGIYYWAIYINGRIQNNAVTSLGVYHSQAFEVTE